MKTLLKFIDYSTKRELRTVIDTLQAVYDITEDRETKGKLNLVRAIAILRLSSLEDRHND